MTAVEGSRRRARPKNADPTGLKYLAGEIAWALTDAAVLTRRNLTQSVRAKETWPFILAQPIVFVLLFSLVFGGAINLPGGGSYREFLIAGVFTQAVAFGTSPTALGVAVDLQLGLMDRFRALPIHPSAIFIGRTVGDLLRMGVSISVMAVAGLCAGWRVHDGPLRAACAFLLLGMFTFGMSWVGAYLGLTAKTMQAAQSLPLLWLFPITFISNVFVPTASMPEVFRVIADWNPVSAVAAATRDLFGNPNPFADPHSFPAQHSVMLTVAWSVGLTLLSGIACTRRMRKVAA